MKKDPNFLVIIFQSDIEWFVNNLVKSPQLLI